MAITKPKPRVAEVAQAAAVDAFISRAPDSAEKPFKGVRKGNKQQISLTIAPLLLEKVDALADQLGQSRAGVINLALSQLVERGLVVDSLHKE